MYIAIAGNIGSGKTTLAEMLAKHYDAHAHYEDPDNPYIGDFYDSMSRWSFNLQVYFLSSRIQQTKEMLQKKEECGWKYLFQDRTIYEDAYIFATNLNEMGLLSSRDFATYMKTFQLFEGFLPKPDLLIYLRASVPKLKEQIQKRGREYESSIDSSYLKCLNDKYENWIENIYKGNLLIVDKDSDDFEGDSEIFKQICDRIESLK